MIALDIDGTLARTEPVLHGALAAHLGIDPALVTPSTVYDTLFNVPQGRELEAALFIQEQFNRPEVYRAAVPVPGALEVVSWIARRGLLRGYVTRRPESVTDATGRWLDQHGFPPSTLIHVERGPCKSESCRSIHASVIVEDSPAEAQRCLDAGMTVILLDQPYNRSFHAPGLLRAANWHALGGLLERLPLDYRRKTEKRF